MISAAHALQLPVALPTASDITDCRNMMRKLDQHVRKYMAFGGPPPLEIPFHEMSKTAGQLLCFATKRFKWIVNLNLMAEEARFKGGAPVPHHWLIQMQPMPEVYDEQLPETLLVSSEDASPLA